MYNKKIYIKHLNEYSMCDIIYIVERYFHTKGGELYAGR